MMPHRLALTLVLLSLARVSAAELPKVAKVERQPLAAQAQRVADALDFLGSPLPDADKKALRAAAEDSDPSKAVATIQSVLDQHCLAGARIHDGKVETLAGPARPELAEQGW